MSFQNKNNLSIIERASENAWLYSTDGKNVLTADGFCNKFKLAMRWIIKPSVTGNLLDEAIANIFSENVSKILIAINKTDKEEAKKWFNFDSGWYLDTCDCVKEMEGFKESENEFEATLREESDPDFFSRISNKELQKKHPMFKAIEIFLRTYRYHQGYSNPIFGQEKNNLYGRGARYLPFVYKQSEDEIRKNINEINTYYSYKGKIGLAKETFQIIFDDPYSNDLDIKNFDFWLDRLETNDLFEKNLFYDKTILDLIMAVNRRFEDRTLNFYALHKLLEKDLSKTKEKINAFYSNDQKLSVAHRQIKILLSHGGLIDLTSEVKIKIFDFWLDVVNMDDLLKRSVIGKTILDYLKNDYTDFYIDGDFNAYVKNKMNDFSQKKELV